MLAEALENLNGGCRSILFLILVFALRVRDSLRLLGHDQAPLPDRNIASHIPYPWRDEPLASSRLAYDQPAAGDKGICHLLLFEHLRAPDGGELVVLWAVWRHHLHSH